MFVECWIRACESVSNLSRRNIFVEHSLHTKIFYRRTTKNSTINITACRCFGVMRFFTIIYSFVGYEFFWDHFCTENEFCRMKVRSHLMKNLIKHPNHSQPCFHQKFGLRVLRIRQSICSFQRQSSLSHYYWRAMRDSGILFKWSWWGSNSSCVTTAWDVKSLYMLGSLTTYGRTSKKLHGSDTQLSYSVRGG